MIDFKRKARGSNTGKNEMYGVLLFFVIEQHKNIMRSQNIDASTENLSITI